MRFSAILGGLIASAMFGSSMGTVNTHMQLAPSSVLRPLPRHTMSYGTAARPARIERHSGAGGPGMHRAWKRRRASGRA